MKALFGRLVTLLILAVIAYGLYQWLLVPVLLFQMDTNDVHPKLVVYRVPYPKASGRFKTIGQVVAFEEKAITSPVSGKIVEVYVSQGDLLDEGAPLFRIDTKSARQKLLNLQTQAQSLLENDDSLQDEPPEPSAAGQSGEDVGKPAAKAMLAKGRMSVTVSGDLALSRPKSSLTSAEDVLKADIARQARLVSDAVIRMPYRAQVKTVLVESDMTVEKGETAMMVDGGHDLDVKIQLPWDDLNRLTLKQQAIIESIDKPFPLRYTGSIVSIESQALNPKSLAGTAIIRIPRYAQPQFDSSQSVMVHLAYTRPGFLTIPAALVHQDGQSSFVFYAKPSSSVSGQAGKTVYVVSRQPVVVQPGKGTELMVRAGLLPGELLVVRALRAGPIPLGQPVTIQYDDALMSPAAKTGRSRFRP